MLPVWCIGVLPPSGGAHRRPDAAVCVVCRVAVAAFRGTRNAGNQRTGTSSSDRNASGAVGLVRRVVAAAAAGVGVCAWHAAGLPVARRHDGPAVGDCRRNGGRLAAAGPVLYAARGKDQAGRGHTQALFTAKPHAQSLVCSPGLGSAL